MQKWAFVWTFVHTLGVMYSMDKPHLLLFDEKTAFYVSSHYVIIMTQNTNDHEESN